MFRKKSIYFLFLLLSLVDLSLISVFSSRAVAQTPGGFDLRLFRNQNYCIDVQGANIKNGTRIQLWPCNKSKAQIWQIGNIDYNNCNGEYGCAYQIRLKANPNYCLDYYNSPYAPNPNGGTYLHLWSCSNANHWMYGALGCNFQCSRIYPLKFSQQVIDLSGNIIEAGRTIQLWPSNYTSAQDWVTRDYY